MPIIRSLASISPYDQDLRSEALARYWALHAVKNAIPFRLHEPLEQDQRAPFVEYLCHLTDLAAPSTDLTRLAEVAATSGLRSDDLDALSARCDELLHPIGETLRAAGPSRQKTLASLVAMFVYGNIRFPNDAAALMKATVVRGLGSQVAQVSMSQMPGQYGEKEALEAALTIGKATPSAWRTAVEAEWRQEGSLPSRDPHDAVSLWTLRYRCGRELGMGLPDGQRRLLERAIGRTVAEYPTHLAMVARSSHLRQAAEEAIRAALYFLVDDRQQPDGSWASPSETSTLGILRTADATIALARLGYRDTHRTRRRMVNEDPRSYGRLACSRLRQRGTTLFASYRSGHRSGPTNRGR
jgi:hypothetical protein